MSLTCKCCGEVICKFEAAARDTNWRDRALEAEAELAAIHAEKRQDMIDGLTGKIGLATLLHKTEAELARVMAEAAIIRGAAQSWLDAADRAAGIKIASTEQGHRLMHDCIDAGEHVREALSSTSAGAGGKAMQKALAALDAKLSK